MLIFFVFIAFSSCKKDDSTPSDPLYPTIVERLNSIDYSNKMTEYWGRNPYLQSDLNGFGFCAETDNYRELDAPGTYKEITYTAAKTIVKKFISKNPKETGIKDTTNVDLTVVRQYASGNFFVTIVQTQEQMIDTLSIRYSTLSFRIENEQVVECVNNWFSDVYVPSTFFITPEKAIDGLVGEEYSLPTMSGSVTGNVVQSDLEGATLETLIIQYPNQASINTTQKLELRIVYKIFLPNTWTIFYVDVMYGTVLDTDATIVSKKIENN
jgi:hypothetical protein